MRVLLDVPSAEFGGIRTYVENLLAAWATSHADDADSHSGRNIEHASGRART